MSNYTKSTNFATKDNLPTGDPLKIVKGTEIDTEFNNIATAISTKTDNASAAITGGSITGITDLAIADGGTGASTANAALNNLLPSQASASGKYLKSNGTDASWDQLDISTADITGTLPVANGGTGVTSSTGTGSVVLSNSPTLVTPSLGAATASTLDVSGNVTLSGGTANSVPYLNGSKVVTTGTELYFDGTNLGVGASASYRVDLGSATSDDAAVGIRIGRGGSSTTWSLIDNVGGSGNYRQYSSGTPTLRWLTSTNGSSWSEQMRLNATGLGVGNNNPAAKLDVTGSALVSGSVTASQFYGSFNGAIGNTTAYSGAFTSLTTSSTVTINGGTANGVAYLNGSKVLTTGSVIKFDGTNFTSDRSASTAYSGTNQATWANGIVLNNSATPATGILDSIYFSNSANMQNVFGVAQNSSGYGDFVWAGYAGTHTEWMKLTSSGLTLTSNPTLSGGTANGVTYLNGSKVLTSGSALTFDGTRLGIGSTAAPSTTLDVYGESQHTYLVIRNGAQTNPGYTSPTLYSPASGQLGFGLAASEQMRLTSTGLGIGTSSPLGKLDVRGTAYFNGTGATGGASQLIAAFAASGGSNFGQLINTNTTWSLGYGTSYSSVGTSVLTWDASGNVGIGTSSPKGKVSINVGASGSSTLGDLATAGVTLIGAGGSGNISQIGLGAYSTSLTYSPTAIGYVATNTTGSNYGDLVFATRNVSTDTAPTERLRLDSSGNLGLGVTPSAWQSGLRAFQFGATASIYSNGSNSTFYGLNFYTDSGGTNRYLASSIAASAYGQVAGAHQWYTAPSGTAGNAISFTQAMTLDASGRLLVGGTTAPSTANAKLLLNSTTSDSYIQLANFSGGGALIGSLIGGGTQFYTYTGSVGSETYTERARIDSSGNLLVGVTSLVSSAGGNYGVALRRLASGSGFTGRIEIGHSDSSGARLGAFYYGSTPTLIGSIDGTTTTTSYNTSSDYRLKNSVAPMTGALAKVAQLKPVTYKWNADGSDGEGFIAHELAEVCPHAVTGEKDAVDEDGNPKYQGIDTSFLVATLTAAIQELKAEFDAYKASHP